MVGVVTTNEKKTAEYEANFGVKCFKTPEDLINTKRPDYFIVCVSPRVCVEISLKLIGYGFPVLLETPPAHSLENLQHFKASIPKSAKVQIAEQYPFHPMHSAALDFIKTGKLGRVSFAQISFTHAYHAFALIRKYLDIGFESANITASMFNVPVVGGYTREGPPTAEKIVEKKQTIAVIEFESGKTALLNHEVDQHRSYVRSPIIQIKGERGEIFNHGIKYLEDYKTPVETSFIRKESGREDNFEGYDLKGIMADSRWIYRNPYEGSRLVDDEIAIAVCMDKMLAYVQGDEGFYGLEEAGHDFHLSLMVSEFTSPSLKFVKNL